MELINIGVAGTIALLVSSLLDYILAISERHSRPTSRHLLPQTPSDPVRVAQDSTDPYEEAA